MSEELDDEMGNWEWERESALGRWASAVEGLRAALRERIRDEIAGPILDYLVGSTIRPYCLAAILIAFFLALFVLSWPGN